MQGRVRAEKQGCVMQCWNIAFYRIKPATTAPRSVHIKTTAAYRIIQVDVCKQQLTASILGDVKSHCFCSLLVLLVPVCCWCCWAAAGAAAVAELSRFML